MELRPQSPHESRRSMRNRHSSGGHHRPGRWFRKEHIGCCRSRSRPPGVARERPTRAFSYQVHGALPVGAVPAGNLPGATAQAPQRIVVDAITQALGNAGNAAPRGIGSVAGEWSCCEVLSRAQGAVGSRMRFPERPPPATARSRRIRPRSRVRR
jgi:hypothetical protein